MRREQEKKEVTGMDRINRIISRMRANGLMGRRNLSFLSWISRASLFVLLFSFPVLLPAATVHVIKIDGAIYDPVLDYVKEGIAQAEQEGSQAVIVKLDTPGGSVGTSKKIVQAFYDAKVPVVVYVAPAGASATSAGLMITIAGHLAVMAPGTNIGASHPVFFGPNGYQSVPKDDVMMEKATNDTVSWVKSICDVRGRNEKFAIAAVTESKSYTAEEAVKNKLVDAEVKDLDTLVNSYLDDHLVTLNSGNTVHIQGKGAQVVTIEMTLAQEFQQWINDPNIIAVILLLGFLGIAIEFKSPGLIFPATIGIGLIIFALFAPHLPINYAGLLLIVLGFAFLIAEVFVISHGLLTAAGVISLVLGLLMLFNKKEMPDVAPFMVPNLRPSWWLIIPLVVFIVSVVLVFGGAILRVYRQKVMTGMEDMIGEAAEVIEDVGPEGGKIFIHGEYWNAIATVPIAKGDKVVIKSVDDLVCTVEPKGGKPAAQG
jgi:membrane-bound serine protease (ClpP class)